MEIYDRLLASIGMLLAATVVGIPLIGPAALAFALFGVVLVGLSLFLYSPNWP